MKFNYVVLIAVSLVYGQTMFGMRIDTEFIKKNGIATMDVEKIIDGEKHVYDQYIYNVPYNFLGLTWYTTCYIHSNIKNSYPTSINTVATLLSAKTKALLLALPVSVLMGGAYLLWKKFH